MKNQFINSFFRQLGREYAHDFYRSGQKKVVYGQSEDEVGKVIEDGPNAGIFFYDGMVTRSFWSWVVDFILLIVPFTAIFYAPFMLFKAIKGAIAKEVCFYSYGFIPMYVSDLRYDGGQRYIGDRYCKIPFLKDYEDADKSHCRCIGKLGENIRGWISDKIKPTNIAKIFWWSRIIISSAVCLLYTYFAIFPPK